MTDMNMNNHEPALLGRLTRPHFFTIRYKLIAAKDEIDDVLGKHISKRRRLPEFSDSHDARELDRIIRIYEDESAYLKDLIERVHEIIQKSTE